jgi:3-methyl-2-oxobutanoate hydroxymethyltransferase
VRPTTAVPSPHQQPVTLQLLAEKKRVGVPIVMVTAYDFPSAQMIEESGAIDLVLAGDTGAEMVLGYRGTTPVSLDEMLVMTAAVRRGLRTPLLVGDLPFGSYEESDEQAVRTAQQLVKDGGADVVKLERAGGSLARVRAIVQSGVPVMGHLGLTPQTEAALGGRRVQGRGAGKAAELLADARALVQAGCFAIVLEAVPEPVATAVSARIPVPTIGIGAGAGTDGQVLVWHDLLGLYEWRPRFAKAYANLRPDIHQALSSYADDVRSRCFPASEHFYTIDDEELQGFLAEIED